MRTTNFLNNGLAALVATVVMGIALPANAETTETEEDNFIEEQIVTVERRAQNLQDLGVTAFNFDAEDLRLQGVHDLTDLSELAPGLEIANKQGNIEVWIRGVGSSNNTELGDPAAATHLDGVYLPRPTGIGSGFFDIERVEVNVGPQGTLRGRNATAGSVNIIPWKPGLGVFDAAIEAEWGDYHQRVYRGMVNVPLGDTVAVRFAAYGMSHDSYYNDVGPLDIGVAEQADNEGYRGQLLWEPSERTSVRIAADLLQEEGTGYTGTNYANPLGNDIAASDIKDPRDVYARGFAPVLDTEHWGIKVGITHEFDWATLEYTGSRRDLIYDYDAITPLSPDWPGVANELQPVDENFDDFSRFQFITDSVSDIHELRVFGETEKLNWSAGVFWFEEDQYSFLGSAGDRGLFFQGTEFNQPNTDTSSESVFTDITYNLTNKTRITGGLRYTQDEKSRVGVNARYAFALGGKDFSCCGGVRLGTEGFAFAGPDRTIFEPDANADGSISDDEYLAFYYDGISQFGARDTVEEVFANGTYGGDAAFEDRVACTDTLSQDDFDCPADGRHSFVAIINPETSIMPQYGEMKVNFLDWRLRVEHEYTDDLFTYAMISTGHKSGGFNDTFVDNDGLDIAPTYDEEQVTVYEVGVKTEFEYEGLPVRFNASGFYYDYADQVFSSLLSVEQALDFSQGGVNLVDPADTGSGSLVVTFNYNAADSKIYGMQFDGGFQFPNGMNLDWAALWLEAEIEKAEMIQDFRFQADVAPDEAVFRSIDGKRLPHTPRLQFNASLSQTFDVGAGSMDYIFSYGWRDEQFRTIFNSQDYLNPQNPRGRLNDLVKSFWTLDAGIGYTNESGRFRVEGYVSNISDEVHEAAILITQFDNTRFFTRPRVVGMRTSYRFGG